MLALCFVILFDAVLPLSLSAFMLYNESFACLAACAFTAFAFFMHPALTKLILLRLRKAALPILVEGLLTVVVSLLVLFALVWLCTLCRSHACSASSRSWRKWIISYAVLAGTRVCFPVAGAVCALTHFPSRSRAPRTGATRSDSGTTRARATTRRTTASTPWRVPATTNVAAAPRRNNETRTAEKS